MKDFFYKHFYGSTIGEWSLAMLIVLVGIVLAKIIYWFFTHFIKAFTKRTATKLDDIIIDKIEEPIVVAIVIGSFWWAIDFLNIIKDVRNHVEGFIFLALVLDVAWLISRTIDGLIEEYVVPIVKKSEGNLDDTILPIARRGINYVIWILGVLVGLNNAGYDIATVLGALGIFGIAFAFGARSTVMNIFGGITILINQPFKIGDRIKINTQDGYVEDISLTVTVIRTFLEDTLVTIPNKVFTEKEVTNMSAVRFYKAVFKVNVPFDTPSDKINSALDFMKQLTQQHPNLEKDHKITITEFNDFAFVIQFVYFIKKDDNISFWDTQSDVAIKIMSYFKEQQISFAVKNNTIVLQSETANL